MEIDEKRVTFSRSLTVKYDGKIIEKSDTHITIEGESDDSYIKIFNPFRGVAKLLLFENERWVDAETSNGISNFDFSSMGLEDLSSLSSLEEKSSKKSSKSSLEKKNSKKSSKKK